MHFTPALLASCEGAYRLIKTPADTGAPAQRDPAVAERVSEMLSTIEKGGMDAVLRYAHELDGFASDRTGRRPVAGSASSAVGHTPETWSIAAGSPHMETSAAAGPPLTADGAPALSCPRGQAFTSWPTYRFPSGLMIGGGATYTGG